MYRLLVELLQPFLLLYLLAALMLLNLWRKHREDRRRLLYATIPLFLLGLWCMPALSYLALGSLEWSYPPLKERPKDAQAIVVLSGYARPADSVRPQSELGEDTLYRCLRAAEIYRQGDPCPVLVSGGVVDADSNKPACAPLMRDFLVQLGVPASNVIVEDLSSTTWENAVQSHKLLEKRGITRVVLVTDAMHLFRAVRCYRKQGIEVVPCGCRYQATEFEADLAHFLPSAAGASGMQDAWHEWLGSAWYWLRGRI